MATSTQTSESKQRPNNKDQPLKKYFSQHSKFQYQPRNSPTAEFNRLCKEYQWKQDSEEKKAARDEFNLALIEEFNSLYGSDEKDIKNWHNLCHVLRIDPVPSKIKECREVSAPICHCVDHMIIHFSSQAISTKHVNLVDLLHGLRENIQIFESEKELSGYTKETGKFFPKKSAADGGVLRDLRRHILAPQESRPRKGQLQPRTTVVRSRAFHSGVPIPSKHRGDAPVASAQPDLSMSSSPHAFKFNSPINTPLLYFSPLTQSQHTASSQTGPTGAQRSCTSTIPTTQSNCHVTGLMAGHLRSSFPPLKLFANSRDRLCTSYHPLNSRIDRLKERHCPIGVRCSPGALGLFPWFQYSSSLPRAAMRVRRVIFPVG